MNKCSQCKKFFIFGDAKIIENKLLYHKKCFEYLDTINQSSDNNKISENNTIINIKEDNIGSSIDSANEICRVCYSINCQCIENLLEPLDSSKSSDISDSLCSSLSNNDRLSNTTNNRLESLDSFESLCSQYSHSNSTNIHLESLDNLESLHDDLSIRDSHSNSVNELNDDFNDTWTCNICTYSENQDDSLYCKLCLNIKGMMNEINIVDDLNLERWTCNRCTYSENHYLSTECAICLIDRNYIEINHEVEQNDNDANSDIVINNNNDNIDNNDIANINNNEIVVIDNKSAENIDNINCALCYTDLNDDNKYRLLDNCPFHCIDCIQQWIATQITEGKSLALKCPCNNHKLNYSIIRKLVKLNYLTDDVMILYENSLRNFYSNENSKSKLVNISCPACNTIYGISSIQLTYLCINQKCAINSRKICCYHNIPYNRQMYDFNGEKITDLSGSLNCNKCLTESGNNIAINDIMYKIEDAFCDKCPNCKNYVGEPEDFNNCMCLKCNFCPNSFCAFCYNYSSDWNNTHNHVRYCSENPRGNPGNYFAESEHIWRNLMKDRKRNLADVIIESSNLSPSDKNQLRDNIENLL